MEQLTIKELAPYLPFKPLCVCNASQYGVKLLKKDFDVYLMLNLISNDTDYKISLRPLSDLTKEIEVNGKKFVPINKLRSDFITIDGSHRHFDYPFTLDGNLCGVLSLPYWVLIELHSLHFDTFALIDRNLAIDINTI